jgi:hypothetical protein
MSSAPDHFGWRLVATAAVLHAFFVAPFLAAIFIQLIVIAAR